MQATSVKYFFTPEDDKKVIQAVNTHGLRWKIIADELGMSGKKIRDRWKEILDPSLNRGPWTAAEQELLPRVVKECRVNQEDGTTKISWIRVSRFFDHRGDRDLKNFWNSLQTKKKSRVGSCADDLPEDLTTVFEKHDIPPSLAVKKRSAKQISADEPHAIILRPDDAASTQLPLAPLGKRARRAVASDEPALATSQAPVNIVKPPRLPNATSGGIVVKSLAAPSAEGSLAPSPQGSSKNESEFPKLFFEDPEENLMAGSALGISLDFIQPNVAAPLDYSPVTRSISQILEDYLKASDKYALDRDLPIFGNQFVSVEDSHRFEMSGLPFIPTDLDISS